jgi:predicted RNA binding protein YcfA (HicA-like mRNA interferase family)
MGSKLPLLKPREVQARVRALGFKYKRTDGSHETWERLPDQIIPERKVVQMLLASWFGPFRRFNLAHPGTLKVKRIEFRSAGA